MTQERPMITVPAYAKINLTLEVLGKYDDGYHQIASVMQLIDLHDTLSFQPSQDLRLTCNIPDLCSDDNLVLKAARLLRSTTGTERGALIDLHKGIPLDSGLGGGSSDAAATLKALNELWGTSQTMDQLRGLSCKLGSDVTFFLDGATALATGRGEIVTPVTPPPRSWAVLLKPAINVSQKTRRMYAHLEQRHWTSGLHTQRMIESFESGECIPLPLCYNVFEEVAFSFFAGLDRCRCVFYDSGAPAVHLAGSGPTLYTLVPTRAEAEAIMSRLQGEVYLAQTLQGQTEWHQE